MKPECSSIFCKEMGKCLLVDELRSTEKLVPELTVLYKWTPQRFAEFADKEVRYAAERKCPETMEVQRAAISLRKKANSERGRTQIIRVTPRGL